jgi:hypothetical protein
MSVEAMKQWLEALESTHDVGCNKTDEAITSLRQAIAEAEKQDLEQSSTESKETFDQPVAWMDEMAKVPDHVWEPPFRFRRFVAGSERAEDVVVEREATIEAAARKAAKICPSAPMTVLVYTPDQKPRVLEPDYYVYNIDGVYRLADPQPTIRWGKK